jgi:uncharacterized protein (DUF885 family)
MKNRTLATALFISILLLNCKQENKKNEAFAQLTASYFDDKNALDPLSATQNGQKQYDAELELDMTDAYQTKQKNFIEKYENALKKIDTAALNKEEKVSYKIMQWETSLGKEFLAHETLRYLPLDQFSGQHLTMGQFAGGESAQPFKTIKDYDNFHSRLEKYSVWLDSAMVYMQKGIEKKIVLPKKLTLKLIPQFESIITTNAEENLYFTTLKKMPTTFSATEKAALIIKYKTLIEKTIIPQHQKIVAFLKTKYLPASRESSGYSDLPNGKAIYESYAKLWTTTYKSPEEIHQLGLNEVARIRSEMEKVKEQVGFKGNLKEFFASLRTKKELMPFNKPEEVIENFNKIYAIIKPNVDKLFSLQPKTPFEIRRTEAFREKTASAEYNQGAADGSRPGVFYVPIPDVKSYNNYGDEDLFLHEAIPGHHFQISLQQENNSLPDFRRYAWFGAYGEGWALYTESLGKELGLYKDPYQYFGMLSMEMHRSIRLVVDTGIHYKGWSREQAIQYSLENEAEGEEGIIAEIERYMAIPGQALSYKLGQLKILELRKNASEKLGKDFDIKKFHEEVLNSGVLPLALLEEKINSWINSSKK